MKLQFLKDSHIMEDFIRREIQGEELAKLNILRIYLKSTYLSDLVIGDRTYISAMIRLGKLNIMNPQCKWPPQSRPHQKAWENWKAALKSTYNLSRSLTLLVHQHLCPILSSATSTGCIYS